jgi:hypothetical protein
VWNNKKCYVLYVFKVMFLFDVKFFPYSSVDIMSVNLIFRDLSLYRRDCEYSSLLGCYTVSSSKASNVRNDPDVSYY